jgi:carboxypeptidase family protein/TonB-dependent receptor-like protein
MFILTFLVMVCCIFPAEALAQVAIVRGAVVDDTGAPLPGATIVLASENANPRETISDLNGNFTFARVALGKYKVRIELTGFQPEDLDLDLHTSEPPSLTVKLTAGFAEAVVVTGDPTGGVLSASRNADALEFDPEALLQLPADMQNLQTLIQSFTAAPPGGVSFVVDGVETSAADIPPAAIHRLWINRNPYAVEYKSPGKSRAEIETHNGSRRYFHGGGALFFRNSAFDARNALAQADPDMQRLLSEGTFGGPLVRRPWSFFVSGQRLAGDDTEVISARTLDGPFTSNASTSQNRTNLLGRVDFRPRRTHALSMRFDFFDDGERGRGVGGLRLAEQAYTTTERRHRFQLQDRHVVSTRMLNEVRASATYAREQDGAAARGEQIVVAGAFTAGASQIFTAEREKSLHAEDVATITMRGQTLRLGARIKGNWMDVLDASNFGGTFNFASLTEFAKRRPILFTVRRGNPEATFSEADAGAFVEVESRPIDSIGVVAGLRYDWQSNLADSNNIAPRVSVAFAPAGQSFVLRGGAGMFYQSLSASAVARSLLFGPAGLQETSIAGPPYPLPSSMSLFQGARLAAWQLDPNLRAPVTSQASIGVERLLWRRTTLAVEYLHMRASGAFRARDINAPLSASGGRPDPARLNVNRIESRGSSQTHAMTATFRGYVAGFKGSAQYILSRTIDDGSGVFDLPANSDDLAAERGRSDFDRRHRLSVAGTYEWAQDRMRLSALFTVASGAPFDITTGSDDNRDSIVNDRPTGITRNFGRGPGQTQLDLRLTGILRAPRPRSSDPESTKREYLDNLDLNLDVFNVLSASNATTIVGVITSPMFGKPAAVRSARAMQLSLRYRF